ncbi:PASTA domain-containing protein [Micromonospora musae]|uniref:PASTA domain-containing protein n=1 Tax=Micromonospora musae TaxID=1894970 RepID=UPI003403614F
MQALSMSYPPPPPNPTPHLPPQPPKRRLPTAAIIGIVIAGLVAFCCASAIVGAIIQGSNDSRAESARQPAAVLPSSSASVVHSPAATTPPTSAAPASSAARPSPSAAAQLKMPNLVGENAQVAYETLTDLGFTKVTFGSQDDDDKVVLFPPNWTVTKQSAKAGVLVRADKTIVLTCTKEG